MKWAGIPDTRDDVLDERGIGHYRHRLRDPDEGVERDRLVTELSTR